MFHVKFPPLHVVESSKVRAEKTVSGGVGAQGAAASLHSAPGAKHGVQLPRDSVSVSRGAPVQVGAAAAEGRAS